MELLEQINGIPLFRSLGLPSSLRNICVIVFKSELASLEQFLDVYPSLELCRIFVPDLEEKLGAASYIEIKSQKIPLSPISEIGFFPELEKVFICSANPIISAVTLSRTAIYAANFNVRNFYLYGTKAPEYSTRNPLPSYFRQHKEQLELAVSLFADEPSRETFAGRVKAICSGNAGFMPIAPHSEYFHPLVMPEKDDFMLDGGVSDMVQSQKDFLACVGPKGQIFGFEPIPSMARKAKKILEAFPNYHLQVQGLAEKPGQAVFKDLRDSSHLAAANDTEGINCELTSIDAFCAANHITRLNCIKLDVEGAELLALKGGEKMIRETHPKLIICLYHKPQDMWEIPMYIKKLVPEYQLYLAHSSSQFTDTILYGIVPQSG